jgi:hypothetical protein
MASEMFQSIVIRRNPNFEQFEKTSSTHGSKKKYTLLFEKSQRWGREGSFKLGSQ